MSPAGTDLVPTTSSAIGQAWAHDVANGLRAQTGGVVGAWPGTMREVRTVVLVGVPAARQPSFDPETLQALCRAVYDAARRAWDELSEPDLEP